MIAKSAVDSSKETIIPRVNKGETETDQQEDVANMAEVVIFPGVSTHECFSGPTTTKHLRLIADALESSGVAGVEIEPQIRKLIEMCLYFDDRKRGPLGWRIFAEHHAGGSRDLVKILNSAENLLRRFLMVGVESDNRSRFAKLVDKLECLLEDEPINARKRLRWLCSDIIQRLESETDEYGFGNVEVHIDEIAALAVLLEFESPPLQRMCYERDGTSSVAPKFGHVWPDSLSWTGFRSRNPEFLYAFGLRIHDPAGGFPVEIQKSALVESNDETKPRLHDPWAEQSKADHRAVIVKILKRWISAIDGLPAISGNPGSLSASVSQVTAGKPITDPIRLSITEVAKYIGVTDRAIRDWRKNGKLTAVDDGKGQLVFSKSTLEILRRSRK